MNLVVDASVLVKAYIPENGSDRASALLAAMERGEVELLAPDLIYAECGNILWKKVRRGELEAADARDIAEAIKDLPLQIESGRTLLSAAFDIAVISGATVYDALYVALAHAYDTRMLTADRKLVSALANTPFSEYIEGVGG